MLALDLELFPGLVENALIKVFTLLRCLIAKLLPEFDLLVQHVFDLLDTILLLLFLLADLLLVQLLAELLNFAPLVLANIRRQVVYLAFSAVSWPSSEIVDLLFFGRCEGEWL